ncbi:MAG: hypothetical protein HYZ53_07530 [Planctomycetes bacterium]|nr:hypothetical protein [Planctomycetota bacterium]
MQDARSGSSPGTALAAAAAVATPSDASWRDPLNASVDLADEEREALAFPGENREEESRSDRMPDGGRRMDLKNDNALFLRLALSTRVLNATQLRTCIATQRKLPERERLGEIAVRLGYVRIRELGALLCLEQRLKELRPLPQVRGREAAVLVSGRAHVFLDASHPSPVARDPGGGPASAGIPGRRGDACRGTGPATRSELRNVAEPAQPAWLFESLAEFDGSAGPLRAVPLGPEDLEFYGVELPPTPVPETRIVPREDPFRLWVGAVERLGERLRRLLPAALARARQGVRTVLEAAGFWRRYLWSPKS